MGVACESSGNRISLGNSMLRVVRCGPAILRLMMGLDVSIRHAKDQGGARGLVFNILGCKRRVSRSRDHAASTQAVARMFNNSLTLCCGSRKHTQYYGVEF